jgi:phosphoribosyl 1,2-cyclic phosphodiesterase
VELVLCGVRGSTPAPGADFARTGGHTSCLAIRRPGDRWLVLDAGTGIRGLGSLTNGAALRGSILLTHLHWDHTQGLPFVPQADRPDAQVDLYLPRQPDTDDAASVFARAMSPPHFPIGPEGLRGDWSFRSLEVGTHRIEGCEVTAAEITHKGGRTFGYRVDDGETTIAYLPDHAPAIATPEALESAIELTRGVDLLLHDAQFVEAERGIADLFGHATIDDAIAFARSAEVEHLVLIHHAPARTDDEVDAIERATATEGPPLRISVGREGDELVVTNRVPDQMRS